MPPTLTWLGGASEVGRVAALLTGPEGQLLLDCGMHVGHPPAYPPPLPPVDALLLTHAHVDHCGTVPSVTRHSTPLVCTPVTGDLAGLMLRDSAKIAMAEGYPLPYPESAVEELPQHLRPLTPGRSGYHGGFEYRLLNAGHVPGAVMFHFPGLDLLFTGDLNTIDTGLTRGAQPLRCRTLAIEATYAGREHPPRAALEAEFIAAVEEVVARGGTAVIPAFALGRSQEVLMMLADLGFEIWYDGMGREVTRLFLDHRASLRDVGALQDALAGVRYVHHPGHRRHALQGDVIVTTSGMLEGGPVLGYLSRLRHDARSAVLLTGYQVPGTNGRRLLDDGCLRVARDRAAEPVSIACQVRHFDLSAHAGHAELLAFIRGCQPERVILYHGEQRETLAADLAGECEVIMPMEGEPVEVG